MLSVLLQTLVFGKTLSLIEVLLVLAIMQLGYILNQLKAYIKVTTYYRAPPQSLHQRSNSER